MRHSAPWSALGLGLLALVTAGTASASSSARYEVIDLVNPSGGQSSSAQYDVSDNLDPLGNTALGAVGGVFTAEVPPEDQVDPIPVPETTTPQQPDLVPTGGGALAPLADAIRSALDSLLAPLAALADQLVAQPGASQANALVNALAALATAALVAVPALTGLGIGAAGAGVGLAQSVAFLTNNWLFAWFRKRKYAGRVYDVATKQPVAGATVRLIAEAVPGFAAGKLVATAVTNEVGEYRLSGRTGQYRLEVVAPAYRFPSKFSATGYRGEHLAADPSGDVLVDVPLDGKTPATVIRVLQVQQLGRLLGIIRLPVLLLGSASAVIFVLGRGSWIDWLVLGMYGLFWLLEYRGYRLARRQTLVQVAGVPTRLAVLRAFTAQGQLLITKVTDRTGRATLFLPPGTYTLEVAAPGCQSVREQLTHRVAGPVGAVVQVPTATPDVEVSWLPVRARTV